MKINLFKIKKGKLDTWLKWCELLNTTHREEAIETLKEEGLSYEGFSVFELNGENYTVGFSQGKHLPANISKELNQKHKEIKKECLEYVGPVEMSYELNINSQGQY